MIQPFGVAYQKPALFEESLTTILETEYVYGVMELLPDVVYEVEASGFTCYSNYWYWYGTESNVLGPVYTYVDALREIKQGPVATMLELEDWSDGYKMMYEGHTFYTTADDEDGWVPQLWNGSEFIELEFDESFNMDHLYHATFTGYGGQLAIRWPLATQEWREGWDPFAPQGDGVTFVVRGGLGRIYTYGVDFEVVSGISVHGVAHG